MINILNLFLVLFTVWISFAFTGNVLSWPYVIFGLVASAVISFVAWKVEIINKKTNFIFLNLGFYRHFIPLFFLSIFTSIFLILKSTILRLENNPATYHFPVNEEHSDSDLILFIASITIIPGIFCIGISKKEIMIHALDERYFKVSKLRRIYDNLHKINDDISV